MTDHEPNDEQRQLIRSTDGIYKVDAGAGTGKTFTITRRYAHILENTDAEPDDMLLITFTENAAENMKERIINYCSYDLAELREAPICTFHSYCKKVLDTHGFNAPQLLGIDDNITTSTRIIQNKVLEQQQFRRFLNTFIENHPEHNKFYRIMWDYGDLLDLIKSLCCKGIFPTGDGWFRNCGQYLDGDFDAFKAVFDEINEPQEGSRGLKNSELKGKLDKYRKKVFPDDAPTQAEIRAGENTVPDNYAQQAFEEEREDLKQFIHDLYLEYVEYALSRNYMNFQFLMMFAYVLIVEDDELRDELSFEYMMVDEFQDTNEVQFKLSLLLSGTGNIAVVGDWKQSIFSFQYASVDNILRFEDRLSKYKADMNAERARISYPVDDVETISLTTNYRSGQDILDAAEQSLLVEATNKDSLDTAAVRDKITGLEADEDKSTEVAAFHSDEEIDAVLHKIQQVVGNEEYPVEADDHAVPQYSDIAVLTRTRSFGLELQKAAREYGIPVAYEGGVELFTTDPAILLLAWLRVLHWKRSRRGWAVILEQAGYNLAETKQLLENERYPDDMEAFREELLQLDDVGAVARRVFDRYGIDNGFAAKIIEVLQNTFDTSYMHRGDIIRFIEDNIEEEETYEVDNSLEEDVVTIQTIHSVKGLEYPVVFIADMNEQHFPSTGSSSSPIRYREPVGLRQTKHYRDTNDCAYVYDNWRSYILFKSLAVDYDEERRLLYVAMTRAEQYLFLSAERGKESRFFTGIGVEPVVVEPSLERSVEKSEELPQLTVEEPVEKAPLKLGAHAVVGEVETGEGRGPEFGTTVHRFAEYYVKGKPVDAGDEADYANVRRFIDSLEGDLVAERVVLLPLDRGGRRITLEGTIDLLHETEDTVTIIDFKTDQGRDAVDAYRRQLSVYYHAVDRLSSKDVALLLYFTADDERVPVDPVPIPILLESLSD